MSTGTDNGGGTPGRHPSRFSPSAQAPRSLRSRWAPLAAVVAGVVALSGVLAFGLARDPMIIGSPLVGRAAPEFVLETIDGGSSVRLSGLRGQVVVVNFWASWCRECRVEHLALDAAWRRYRDRGVVFLGITFQDSRPAALAYLSELGGDWPILTDPESRAAIAYGVYGIPETFVIDSSGRVSHRFLGPVDYVDLDQAISRLTRSG